jgi:hypothetical protein
MLLNQNRHFLAAQGYRSYEKAAAAIAKATSDAKETPLMIIAPRIIDGNVDYVAVCVIDRDSSLHNAVAYASRGIYVTNTRF